MPAGAITTVTNITSASSGVDVNTLTGWTRVVAPSQDLPLNSVSTAFLCQTDPAVAPTVRIDATASLFAGGMTYYRASYMVRLIKTDNEVGTAPTNYTIVDIAGNAGGFSSRTRVRLIYTAPSAAAPDLSRYTPSIGGFNLAIDSQAGTYGTEGGFNLTESGNMFHSSTGSATSPTGGAYTPNLPLYTWVRMDLCFDVTNSRFWIGFNGHAHGMFSFISVADPDKDWTLTLPAMTGFLWHLCEMSSWGDTVPSGDTGLTVLQDSRNGRAWSAAPTFMAQTAATSPPLNHLTSVAALTNATLTLLPYSLTSGNRPKRERARWTTTSASGVSCPFDVSGLPVVFNSDGLFNVCTHIRLGSPASDTNGNTWSMWAAFSGAGASFNINYTGGAYKLTDAAGTVLGSWAINELVQWVLTINEAGQVWSTIYNQSKDSTTAGGAPTSVAASLNAGDAAPTTTFTMNGAFTATVIGDLAEMEAWEGYTNFAFALADSYTEAPCTGNEVIINVSTLTASPGGTVTEATSGATGTYLSTTASAGVPGVVRLARISGTFVGSYALTGGCTATGTSMNTAYGTFTFANAYRATINYGSLLNVADNQADCNAHGCMVFPQGTNYPRIVIADAWGRSGKKFTDWYTHNVANSALNNLYGATPFVVCGIVNDMVAATDLASSTTTANTLAANFAATARFFLDRLGGFIWIRSSLPYYRPASSLPVAPLAGQWPYDCWYRSMTAITTALATVQRTHPRGSKLVIADSGCVDFDDGLHLGANGSVPAFVNAGPQIAAALGQSFVQGGTTSVPGQANFGGAGKKKLVVIQG